MLIYDDYECQYYHCQNRHLNKGPCLLYLLVLDVAHEVADDQYDHYLRKFTGLNGHAHWQNDPRIGTAGTTEHTGRQ